MAKIKGDKRYSIVTDHLGTPLAMFDEAGEKSWSADTDIYGNLINVQGNRSDCPFRFPGQYEDEETGLYYNRFRYYDAEMGGYISQDPIRLAGGQNLYSFTSDVTIFFDAFGLADQVVTALFQQNGIVYEDVNPTARSPRVDEAIPAPSGAKGNSVVNRNMYGAHAEVGAMNQSYKAGNRGGRAILMVEGQPICGYCQNDVKKMGRLLELDSLEIHELDTGAVVTLDKNDMKAVPDGGVNLGKKLKECRG